MNRIIALGLIATMGMVGQSCNKDDEVTQGTGNNQGSIGTFKVRMTDAPANYAALNVQITKVEAFSEGSGWIALNSQSQMVSVLNLTNGTETILANANVSAGVYTKLRLTFGSSNTLTMNAASGGNTVNLGFGSNTSQQVEIEIDETVQGNTGADVLIDFNVANSIITFGNTYIINPILDEIEDYQTGVRGDVDGANYAHVTIWNGQDSLNSYTNFHGKFLIRGLDAGTYTLKVEACSDEPGELNTATLQGINVVNGQIKDVGTIHVD